ncbi:MAG TPA: hypothetical protein VII45_01780, partial [Solirubrobacterales bacterium]
MPIIELVDTSHHHAEIQSPNLDHSADPEKAATGGGIRLFWDQQIFFEARRRGRQPARWRLEKARPGRFSVGS